MGAAVFVDEAGDFDVVAAVFGDFEEAALFEPADGLEAFAGFLEVEGGGGDGVEGEPVLEGFLEVDHEVEGGELSEIEGGVTVEDDVIEAQVVEANDEVGALELLDEVVDRFLVVDAVIAALRAVGDADAEAHAADMIPPADLVGGPLGFDIEVNDIGAHRPCYERAGIASKEKKPGPSVRG